MCSVLRSQSDSEVDFLSDKTNLEDFNKILKIYINDPDRTQ